MGLRSVSTPESRSDGGGGWLDCVRAPRKPRYSLAFLQQLAAQDRIVSSERRTSVGSVKRGRAEDDAAAESRTGGDDDSQRQKKRTTVSWEAEDVTRLSSTWSALPPLPMGPTAHRSQSAGPVMVSPPLSPAGSLRAMNAGLTASGLPLSPVSQLSRALQRSCLIGRQGETRVPAPLIRLTAQRSPVRARRILPLPPVPLLMKGEA